MKIESIGISGFRGFNENRLIEFHPLLTLIYAPNSYGKTSISEALEWLLYSETSKNKLAGSIDEYKGSYRNIHLDSNKFTTVNCVLSENGSTLKLERKLNTDNTSTLQFDGSQVEAWPFSLDLEASPKPFIFQHALKYLLLTGPIERYKGFALLLGFEDLSIFQKEIHSFSTKPEAALPTNITKYIDDIDEILQRLNSQDTLKDINRSFKKGIRNIEETYEKINSVAMVLIHTDTEGTDIHEKLVNWHKQVTKKIFKGSLSLEDYSDLEKENNANNESSLLLVITKDFISQYTDLLELKAVQNVINTARFFEIGLSLLEEENPFCPFCEKPIEDELLIHINEQHDLHQVEKNNNKKLITQKEEVSLTMATLETNFNSYVKRIVRNALPLINSFDDLEKIEDILVPDHQNDFNRIKSSIETLKSEKEELDIMQLALKNNFVEANNSISNNNENSILMESLGENIVKLIAQTKTFSNNLSRMSADLITSSKVFKEEIDSLAEVEDISLLIDLLSKRSDIEKWFKIKDVLNDARQLKQKVDLFVSNIMIDEIEINLTSDVLHWYNQIKTIGDSKVHFSGFELPRTKKGELKSRKILINATSYDKKLISAVSSLSESKLNLLGLSVSIANNVNNQSIFNFLLIDDPIQSWDSEHEIQFIEVLRDLCEKNMQIILLSHNNKWLTKVRKQCRSLNGRFYEITGYTVKGPDITESEWVKWKQRLKEINSISQDNTASSVKLRQAEEEVRIAICDITSEIYQDKTGIYKSPNQLNSQDVRDLLIKSSVDSNLIDRIVQTFEDTNDAHHDSEDNYSPDRSRLQIYHSWLQELSKELK